MDLTNDRRQWRLSIRTYSRQTVRHWELIMMMINLKREHSLRPAKSHQWCYDPGPGKKKSQELALVLRYCIALYWVLL